MKTITMQAWRRWLLTALVTLSVSFLTPTGAFAEADHLEGYRIKDLNQVVAPANPYTIANQFGNESCELKKAQFFLVPSQKDGGDDPRAGLAEHFVCYKAKCSTVLPPVTAANSQFGAHSLESKKAKLICLPVDVCGNNLQEGTEACDGADDAACPNDCLANCTCAAPCPTSGGDATACSALGSSVGCILCCNGDASCSASCSAAQTASCGTASLNDSCSAAANAAGCASECCQ